MNCPHCSAELPEGSRFCGNCGKSIDEPAGQSQAPPPPPSAPPPPSQQGGYYSGPPSDMEEQERMNVLAIISLVTGILSLPLVCCCYLNYPFGLAALITGAIAIAQCNKNEKLKGKGMAIAGLVLGILGIVVGVVFIIIMLAAPEMQNWQRNFR